MGEHLFQSLALWCDEHQARCCIFCGICPHSPMADQPCPRGTAGFLYPHRPDRISRPRPPRPARAQPWRPRR